MHYRYENSNCIFMYMCVCGDLSAVHMFNQVENGPVCVSSNKLNHLNKSASSDSEIRLKAN